MKPLPRTRKRERRFSTALVLGVILALASCSSPQVQLLTKPITNSPFIRALSNPDDLTRESIAVLEDESLMRTYRRDRDKALAELHTREISAPSEPRRLAMAEILVKRGEHVSSSEQHRALGFFLEAAKLSSDDAFASQGEAIESPYRSVYNYSCAKVGKLLYDHQTKWDQTFAKGRALTVTGPFTTFRLTLRTSGLGTINPLYFDEVLEADRMKIKGVKLERIVIEGLGAAMVGHRIRTEERRSEEPFLAASGMALPINVLLRFPSADADVVLEVRDLLLESTAPVLGTDAPLSADFTAPLAYLYNFTPKGNVGFKAMLKPGEYSGETGLFKMEPFRKNKIPLVLVHGLMSSPETWVRMINMLQADPVLRRNYQVFTFRYSSGFRLTQNAANLRAAVQEAMDHVDPERNNPRMRQLVMIGHSMGGMLTNLQIRDSGDAIFDLVFDEPLDDLDLPEKERLHVRKMAFFAANPDLHRVVFIASPHRGSKLATSAIGRLGAFLIRLPADIVNATVQQLLSFGGLSPEGSSVLWYNNSVRSLRPDNPLLPVILDLPLGEDVTYHSIIAQADPRLPLVESSDKVVAYTSAHLEGAASEKIILNASHVTVLEMPETAEEVRRILYLHKGLPPPGEPLKLPLVKE